MNDKVNALIILTPGFPENEEDSTCLPERQVLVKAITDHYPGLKIFVLSFHYPYQKKRYNWFGVEVVSFNGRNRGRHRRLLLWHKVWKELNFIKAQYNIIGLLSFWLGECGLISKYFARRNSLKQYCWLLGQDARKGNKYYKFIQPTSQSLIALSDFLSHEFQKNYGFAPSCVIPSGIDQKNFVCYTGSRSIDIMGAGSLIPLKKFDVLIRVVKRLSVSFPQINAIICGKGIEKNNLQNLINELNLEENVSLIDEQPHAEVLKLMQQSKLFLHTSSYEGFSTVCLEALYAGAQVISFCKPMNEEIKNMHIVHSPKEMMQKASVILSDENHRHEPSFPYPIENTVKKLMDLYIH